MALKFKILFYNFIQLSTFVDHFTYTNPLFSDVVYPKTSTVTFTSLAGKYKKVSFCKFVYIEVRRVVSSARFTLENWISLGKKLTFATRNWPETFSRQFVSICFSPTNLEIVHFKTETPPEMHWSCPPFSKGAFPSVIASKSCAFLVY